MLDSNEKKCNTVTQMSGHCAYQFNKAIELGFVSASRKHKTGDIWQCPICRRMYEYDADTKNWKQLF
jgi:hypothetical protein